MKLFSGTADFGPRARYPEICEEWFFGAAASTEAPWTKGKTPFTRVPIAGTFDVTNGKTGNDAVNIIGAFGAPKQD